MNHRERRGSPDCLIRIMSAASMLVTLVPCQKIPTSETSRVLRIHAILTLFVLCFPSHLSADDPIEVGMRRELFVDDHLLESLSSGVALQVQQPVPRDVVLVTGEPWEGNTCAYYTVFQDGDLYRMYYRGSHSVNQKSVHEEVTCYAESTNGIVWTKPKLGLFDWDGSKDNNIVLRGIGTHCFVAFRDENPNCLAEARYKGIARGRPVGKKGLYIYQSPDAIHWSLIKDEPVITEGFFDSQNLAFWDPVSKKYVCYYRTFVDNVRSIMMTTSDDYVNWTESALLKYGDAPVQHLYTNAIRPYPDAPHLRIGFPTRFSPETQQVEPLFMSSRDGLNFHRFDEAIIPRTAPKERDGNRSNYMANGLLKLPDLPEEWSVYATEGYYSGPNSRLRRFVYRMDGFVALSGSGEVLTKPFTFIGDSMKLNYKCSEGGFIQVELCDQSGQPIEGLAGNDCQLTGDATNQNVSWMSGQTLGKLSGTPVRLRFILKNAELFALQFGK